MGTLSLAVLIYWVSIFIVHQVPEFVSHVMHLNPVRRHLEIRKPFAAFKAHSKDDVLHHFFLLLL